MDREYTQTLEWLESQPKQNQNDSQNNHREQKHQINQMLNFLDYL